MKKNKILIHSVWSRILLSTFLLVPVWLQGQPVSETEALLRARNFLTAPSPSSSVSRRVRQNIPRLQVALASDAYFIVNDEANGNYVVVSSDERMPSILGYSYGGMMDVEHIPCNLKAWLEGYDRQLQYIKKSGQTKPAQAAAKDLGSSVNPLLSTQWEQGAPYNNQCPVVGGQRCLTGCVATAMAQVMYYYKWPQKTAKIIPAYAKYPSFGVTEINWNAMLQSYTNSSDDASQNAVATLMRLCGAAVQMNYGLNESTACYSAQVFMDYFDYAEDAFVMSRDYFSNQDWEWVWEWLIYQELKTGHPVLYSGSSQGGRGGHAFVVDGYDSEGYFHLNLGWGGAYDGFFLLDDIVLPAWNYDFRYYQDALLGLQPSDLATPKEDGYYAVYDYRDKKLTFFYGSQDNKLLPYFPAEYVGSTAPWHFWSNDIEEVVFEPSFASCRLKNMAGFFSDFTALDNIQGWENLNTSEVTHMGAMFSGCKRLREIDLSRFNTAQVTNMGLMFHGCEWLNELDLSHFNTGKVSYMASMFSGCRLLQKLDVTHFDTSSAIYMNQMFSGCESLTALDLSYFNTGKVIAMNQMFHSCSALRTIYVGDGWNMEKVRYSTEMFQDCQALMGEKGTMYDAAHNDGLYACIDQGTAQPGYLTKWDGTGIWTPSLGQQAKHVEMFRLDGIKMQHQTGIRPASVYIVNGKKILH